MESLQAGARAWEPWGCGKGWESVPGAEGSQGRRRRRETINLCTALPSLSYLIFPESLGGWLGWDHDVFF